jgi:hypothetical protein
MAESVFHKQKKPEARLFCRTSGFSALPNPAQECAQQNDRQRWDIRLSAPPGSPGVSGSNRCNVLGLRAFLALCYLHRYALPFMKGFATVAGDCTVMDKNVFAAFPFNEAETFLVIEPLNGPFYLL